MKKLGAWLIKLADKIISIFNYMKCKWNKLMLFLSFKIGKCDNKMCTCKK